MTEKEQSEVWQTLLETQQAYADHTKAWGDELRENINRGQEVDVFSESYAGIGKQWLDVMQGMLPMSSRNDAFENAFNNSLKLKQTIDKWQNENVALIKKASEYQGFCSDVLSESFNRFKSSYNESSEPLSERELFNLWIDMAEETYADKSREENFEVLIGDLINAVVSAQRQHNLLTDEISDAFGLSMHKELDDARAEVKSLQVRVTQLEKRIEIVESGKQAKKIKE